MNSKLHWVVGLALLAFACKSGNDQDTKKSSADEENSESADEPKALSLADPNSYRKQFQGCLAGEKAHNCASKFANAKASATKPDALNAMALEVATDAKLSDEQRRQGAWLLKELHTTGMAERIFAAMRESTDLETKQSLFVAAATGADAVALPLYMECAATKEYCGLDDDGEIGLEEALRYYDVGVLVPWLLEHRPKVHRLSILIDAARDAKSQSPEARLVDLEKLYDIIDQSPSRFTIAAALVEGGKNEYLKVLIEGMGSEDSYVTQSSATEALGIIRQLEYDQQRELSEAAKQALQRTTERGLNQGALLKIVSEVQGDAVARQLWEGS